MCTPKAQAARTLRPGCAHNAVSQRTLAVSQRTLAVSQRPLAVSQAVSCAVLRTVSHCVAIRVAALLCRIAAVSPRTRALLRRVATCLAASCHDTKHHIATHPAGQATRVRCRSPLRAGRPCRSVFYPCRSAWAPCRNALLCAPALMCPVVS